MSGDAFARSEYGEALESLLQQLGREVAGAILALSHNDLPSLVAHSDRQQQLCARLAYQLPQHLGSDLIVGSGSSRSWNAALIELQQLCDNYRDFLARAAQLNHALLSLAHTYSSIPDGPARAGAGATLSCNI